MPVKQRRDPVARILRSQSTERSVQRFRTKILGVLLMLGRQFKVSWPEYVVLDFTGQEQFGKGSVSWS